MSARTAHPLLSGRKLDALLLRHHVRGVPVWPIRIGVSDRRFVFAMRGCGAPQRARHISHGAVARGSRIDTAGKPRRDLLQLPEIAIGIVECDERGIAAPLGIRTALPRMGVESVEAAARVVKDA